MSYTTDLFFKSSDVSSLLNLLLRSNIIIKKYKTTERALNNLHFNIDKNLINILDYYSKEKKVNLSENVCIIVDNFSWTHKAINISDNFGLQLKIIQQIYNAQPFYNRLLTSLTALFLIEVDKFMKLLKLDVKFTNMNTAIISKNTFLNNIKIKNKLQNTIKTYTEFVNEISTTFLVNSPIDVVTYTTGFHDILTAVFL